jgi:hypothetical protein
MQGPYYLLHSAFNIQVLILVSSLLKQEKFCLPAMKILRNKL